MEFSILFRNYLLAQPDKASDSTIKNYAADVSHFTHWFEQAHRSSFNPELVNVVQIENFKSFLQSANYTPATIERHISALRRFFQFLKNGNTITHDPFENVKENKPLFTDPFHLTEFKNFLYGQGQKANTIKNYLLDISQFTLWLKKVYPDFDVSEQAQMAKVNSEAIAEYTKRLLEVLKLSPASVNRKLSSLRQYCQWVQDQGNLKENPFDQTRIEVVSEELASQLPPTQQAPVYPSDSPVSFFQKMIHRLDGILVGIFIAPITNLYFRIKPFNKSKPAIYLQAKPNTVATIEKAFYSPYHETFFSLSQVTPKTLSLIIIFILFTGFAGIFAYQRLFAPTPAPQAIKSPQKDVAGKSEGYIFSGRLTDKDASPITQPKVVIFSFYGDPESFDDLLHQEASEVSPNTEGFFSTNLTDVPQALLTSQTPVYLGLTIQGDAEMRPRQLVSGQAATALFDSQGKFIIANDSPSIIASSGTFTIEANQISIKTAAGSDGSIVFSPDGAGKVDVLSPLTNSITGVLEIADSLAINATGEEIPLSISSNATPLASIDAKGLLKTKSLAVEGASTFRGDITPDLASSYNIGSSQKTWNNIYANNVFGASAGTQGFWQRSSGAISPTNITDDLLIGAIASSSAKIRLARDNGNITTSGDIAINGGDITTGSSTFTISDGSNALLTIIDNGGSADAIVQGANFVGLNSYFGEEFARDRADLAADTTLGWGDTSGWSLDVNSACTSSIVDDTINGISRLTLTASNSCLLYTGSTTSADAHLLFDADNKPVILMKVRPSAVSSTEDLWVGIGDDTAGSSTPPSNGIFFTNNGGTTWTGVTRSSSTATTVSCSGQTISTSQFALLKIEVRSTSNVRFFVDSDVSNGISFTECGSGSSTNIPTTTLAGMIKNNTTSAAQNLDIDFFRVWQDDPPAGPDALQAGGPIENITRHNQQSGADIVENYLTSNGQDIEPGTVVSISSELAFSVEPSRNAYNTNLIGIISTSPRGDLILGEGGKGSVRVALLGRVPVKVSTENGPIAQGDYLTSSSTTGVAMKATRAGPVIGKALEGFPATQGEALQSKIMVFVNLSWYDPNVLVTPSGELFVHQATYSGLLTGKQPDSKDFSYEQLYAGLEQNLKQTVDAIEAGLLITSRLVVNEVILAKDIIADRLEAQNILAPLAQFDTLRSNVILPIASDTVVIDGKLAAKEASISGTLIASNIISENISKIETKIASLAALSHEQEIASQLSTIASDSASLHLDNVFAQRASFFDGLLSLGPSGFDDVSIGGLLSIGSDFIFSNNAIDVLGADLKLQPLGQGGVSIADGKVYIDKSGNLRIEGDVIAGRLSADSADFKEIITIALSPIPNEDLVISLNQKSSLAKGLPYQELVIKGATGSAVLRITSQGDVVASGSGQFANLTTEKLKLPEFIAQVGANGHEEVTNGSLGKGTILAGTLEVTIHTPFVTNESLIYISPTSNTKGVVAYVARQIPGESFTVAISTVQKDDSTFNWWIIN